MDLSNLPLLLPHFENVRRLRTDAMALIAAFPSLVPGVQTFQVSSHQTQVLFFLKGMLEVTEAEGMPCKVPVSIFFDPQYPAVPPRAFVTPESNTVKLSGTAHVDGNTGMIRVTSAWTPSVPAALVQRVYSIIAVLSQQIPLSAQAEAESKLRQIWSSMQAEISAQETLKTEIDRKTATLTEYVTGLRTEISAVEAELAVQAARKPADPLENLKCQDPLGEAVLTGLSKVHALEDWLVVVEEAFKQGHLTLDELVKELRTCKRSLYVERAALKRNAALINAAQSS